MTPTALPQERATLTTSQLAQSSSAFTRAHLKSALCFSIGVFILIYVAVVA